MAEHPNIATLITAKSPFEAEVIAGVLHEAGIPAYARPTPMTCGRDTARRLPN